MTVDANGRILDQRLLGEAIHVGRGGAHALVRCELVDCHIVVDDPDNLVAIYESELTNCQIELKRQLKHSWVFSNDFHRCKFKGKFRGVDFGRSPRPDPLTKQFDDRGELVDCDFTEAILDACRFFAVDLRRIRLAPWPQFVVPHAAAAAALLRQRAWPGTLERYFSLSKSQYSSLTAVADRASSFCKFYGITEHELQQVLHDIGVGST